MSSSNMTKTKLLIGVGVVVLLGAIYGAYQYPYSQTIYQNVGSPAGSTFLSAKVAAIVMAPATASATSSSILNSDASDRIITDGFVSCVGAAGANLYGPGGGVVAWTWQAATTTTSAPATLAGVGPLALNMNVATSTTDDSYNASSTYTQVAARRWKAGSYLTFQTNATSSQSCVAGVHYVAS